MSTISALNTARWLFKWRKVIAAAVILESLLSHKMKKQKKKQDKGRKDMVNNASDMIEDIRHKADDFIEQIRKNMKK